MDVINTLTVDVEDYFQVSAFAKNIKHDDWGSKTLRVEDNTHKLLDIFDDKNVKATFFVLGWVAGQVPSLIKEIADRGHEVACHGYSHQLIYKQDKDVFKEETTHAKSLLEDIVQQEVTGYRAASYSITNKSLWALDILFDAGFKYDSSIFPVHHDTYGITGSPKEPHILQTPSKNRLIEYPLSTYEILGQTLPIAGGGYFRLYPYWLSAYFYRKLNSKNKSFVFYLHPWEVDPTQPRIKSSRFSEFRHYNNLDKCESRLITLLDNFKFTTMNDKLQQIGLFDGKEEPEISY